MKSLAIVLFVMAINTMSAQSTFDKWPAIKEFHGVMSETFHPAEEGNLAPIKARSQEMVEKAEAILKSDIPVEYKTPAILASAERIQIRSKALNKMILAGATDAEIVAKLTDLHETFHEIVGLCGSEKH